MTQPAVRTLTQAILAGGAELQAPAWMLVFPKGKVETTKFDPFVVDEQAAQTVIEKFTALGRDMLIDYDHATCNDQQVFAGKAPAAGWIKELRWDATRGLLARVEWTRRAADMIAAGEYRYHSPVFTTTKGRLSEVLAETLTNDPATKGILPLAASNKYTNQFSARGATMPELSKILGLSPDATAEQLAAAINEANVAAAAAALGLSETATLEGVREAIMSGGKSPTAKPTAPIGGGDDSSSPGSSGQATRRIAAAMGITETDDEAVLIASLRAKYVDATEHAKLAARLEKLEAKAQADDFEAACNAPENRGKVTAANREHLKVVFTASRASFDGLLKTLPVLAASRSEFEGDRAADGPPAEGERKFFPDLTKVQAKVASRKAS